MTKAGLDPESPLALTLESLTIYDVAAALLPDWEPGRSCTSPFREDRNPSFSVIGDGFYAKDHGTGESYNTITFVEQATGLSRSDACRLLIELHQGRKLAPKTRIRSEKRKPQRPNLPETDKGTPPEVEQLANWRSLSELAGLQALIDRGILRFCHHQGFRCLMFLSGDGWNTSLRRVDGKPFPFGSQPKSVCIKGSVRGTPLGWADAIRRQQIIVCEGEGDLMAVAAQAYLESGGELSDVGFMAITGASNDIPEKLRPHFRGKDVVIAAQNDANETGQHAAVKWYRQIEPYCQTLRITLSEVTGRDINDALSAGEVMRLIP